MQLALRPLPWLRQEERGEARQASWSILLKAFSKSMDMTWTDALLSSNARNMVSQVSTMKWSTPEPLSPPYCRAESLVDSFKEARIKDSNTLLNSGMQERFLNCLRLSGALFFGMRWTVSLAQSSGHSRVE